MTTSFSPFLFLSLFMKTSNQYSSSMHGINSPAIPCPFYLLSSSTSHLRTRLQPSSGIYHLALQHYNDLLVGIEHIQLFNCWEMKTGRGKRSEPFWPAIVMKKWLNIKPKVYDFSEDEVDTETESEDDAYSAKDVRFHDGEDDSRRLRGNHSVHSAQIPGISSKGETVRHRRGKSETLRLQYINSKEVRVTIGTWNVSGKLPDDNLEIDEWLCMEEAADMYILGFQEIVPLSAGNVLGAETRRAVPKWEALIRTTLNRSTEPEAKHRSYSAPPSPDLRACSATAEILEDELDDMAMEMLAEEEEAAGTTAVDTGETNGTIDPAKKLHPKRTCGINGDGRLDWPEQSLDVTPQVFYSGSKLRRVWSSVAVVSFDRTEAWSSVNLKRSHHSSGNLGLLRVDSGDTPGDLDSPSYRPETSVERPENGNSEDRERPRRKYVRIVSKQMVGIYVSVWVRKGLRRHVNNVKVLPVGVGLMGYMGNKGSVSVSMSLFQTRLCFVCSHLSSGQKNGDEQRRNADVHGILRRTCFSSVVDGDQAQTIPSHDKIFWFGDLNYRLNMLDAEVREHVAKQQWDELLNADQLRLELRRGHVFEGWKEGPITFAPTYKYEIGSDRYVGEDGEKKRSPACFLCGCRCDRILWLGKGIKQESYQRVEIRLSDHRAVSSRFVVEVEVFDHRKLQRALNFTAAAVHAS
ncbi:type I inositol polyphosphate 5-phosphatase 2-like isoform X3 [Diospyros lotus]|uniref:type I inositol polyphosphate 5-phosphatase 2-like isoform X3 n=1 Tax=Diospyros lotus TaxID=55363 RepID=UPI0022511F88|nr:type I inositol polyphosphate 5-phosphatase 2-like isoform X3 [Diospyros lotus]